MPIEPERPETIRTDIKAHPNPGNSRGLESTRQPGDGIYRDALLSDCGNYRYRLRRALRPLHTLAPDDWLVVVGLNPSTADANQDDPTVRRCVALARQLGKAGLCLINVYALRSTDPRLLGRHPDPVGPENHRIARETLQTTPLVLAAWGRRADPEHIHGIRDLSPNWLCLGLNKDGSPKHPLYVAQSITPIPWSSPPDPHPDHNASRH